MPANMPNNFFKALYLEAKVLNLKALQRAYVIPSKANSKFLDKSKSLTSFSNPFYKKFIK